MERTDLRRAIGLTGINERFGPVHANRDIDLDIAAGTIHGIVGENGAGKTPLMSILYGFYQADSGEIRVNGSRVHIRAPNQALPYVLTVVLLAGFIGRAITPRGGSMPYVKER